MTERGILFSGPMVRALLEGRKTQTRRAIKYFDGSCYAKDPAHVRWQPPRDDGPAAWRGKWYAYPERSGSSALPVYGRRSPYGQPGDRLWVRENHAIVSVDGRNVNIARAERMPAGKTLSQTDGGLELFKVDSETAAWAAERVDGERWRPSIFMPRWACRLVLEVTGVRVERLQEISQDDASAEGVLYENGRYANNVHAYHALWDSLNAKRGYGWNKNPWVWAVTFKKLEGA